MTRSSPLLTLLFSSFFAFAAACLSSSGGPSPVADASSSDASSTPTDGSSSGSDGPSTTGDGSFDTDSAGCPGYIDSDKACGAPSDCAMVARGCYCGQQPVIGISKGLAAKASACEAKAQQECALGCANFPGRVAEDGKSDVDGGTIDVDCVGNKCRTVLK